MGAEPWAPCLVHVTVPTPADPVPPLQRAPPALQEAGPSSPGQRDSTRPSLLGTCLQLGLSPHPQSGGKHLVNQWATERWPWL